MNLFENLQMMQENERLDKDITKYLSEFNEQDVNDMITLIKNNKTLYNEYDWNFKGSKLKTAMINYLTLKEFINKYNINKPIKAYRASYQSIVIFGISFNKNFNNAKDIESFYDLFNCNYTVSQWNNGKIIDSKEEGGNLDKYYFNNDDNNNYTANIDGYVKSNGKSGKQIAISIRLKNNSNTGKVYIGNYGY